MNGSSKKLKEWGSELNPLARPDVETEKFVSTSLSYAKV